MNSRDQEKLLKEILPPDDLADFRQTSLERGLAGLRRERRRRHILRFSAVVAALICISLGLILKSKNPSNTQTTQIQPLPVVASATLTPHVDFINDEQLLALFTNQPVALVGSPGEQHLVFLGKDEDDSTQHQF